MQLTGYPREFKEKEGLLPIEVQDLQISGSHEELERLAKFLLECSNKMKIDSTVNDSIELIDSRPNAKTGVWIQVLSHDK